MSALRKTALFATGLALACPALAGNKTAPSEDFAAAADACVAGLAEGSELETALVDAGWQVEGKNPIGTRYKHDGMNVAIVTSAMFGSPSCVVDGYLAKSDRDGLDEVIEARLAESHGDQLTVNRSGPGTGFTAGKVIAILSFEDRKTGLSTRITAMSMAGAE